MDEQILNTVDAVQENVVDSQSEQITTNEPVNAGSEEVAPSQVDNKPVQSAEENAKFAAIRREAEQKAYQKAQDELIASMYGESHGIYTKADYDKAIAEARAAEERQRLQEEIGVDPDKLKPVFEKFKENDPDFQELKAIRAEKNISTALSDLNNELKDAGVDLQLKDLSETEVSKLPNVDKIINLIETKGHSLADAFFIANKKDIIAKQTEKAQQEAIAKITANAASSPGSLAGGGEGQGKSIFSMDGADFKKLQEEVLRGERKKL